MDLDHHHGLHPFLVSAEVVAHGDGDDGAWWDWTVLERPRSARSAGRSASAPDWCARARLDALDARGPAAC